MWWMPQLRFKRCDIRLRDKLCRITALGQCVKLRHKIRSCIFPPQSPLPPYMITQAQALIQRTKPHQSCMTQLKICSSFSKTCINPTKGILARNATQRTLIQDNNLSTKILTGQGHAGPNDARSDYDHPGLYRHAFTPKPLGTIFNKTCRDKNSM